MNWPHAVLTDSGGFQVYSLAEMRRVSEEGVSFRSPFDGAEVRLTPEDSVRIQHQLGSDIVMALDECLEYEAPPEVVRKSMGLTLRWLERCRREHEKLNAERGKSLAGAGETAAGIGQAGAGRSLFGIVQGHFRAEWRQWSARRTAELGLPGYAIGGLSVGEPADAMLEMLEAAVGELPQERPRYAMGIGLPLNLVDLAARGVDLFDCVVPTRNARNGRAYTFEGVKIIKQARYAGDGAPLEEGCPCAACRRYTRAYLRHLFQCNEILSSRLLTGHNLTFFWRLMERIREAIGNGALEALRGDLAQAYGDGGAGS